MGDALYSLAYVSRSALVGTEQEVEAQIATILKSARRHNQRLNISGALLFTEGNFAQVLEGSQAAVEEVFEAIECDSRHTKVVMLHFHPIEARSFAHWNMAYVGADVARRNGPTASGAVALPDGGQRFIEVLLDQVRRAAAAGKPSPMRSHSKQAA